MRVILIDDEQLALEVLEILIQKVSDIQIVGKFTNPLAVYDELEQLNVDAIFLDMEMGSIHGLVFAEQLLVHYPHIDIVFVTAHAQFAIEAFEVNAIDYLLKPVGVERLEKTILKLKSKQDLHKQTEEKNIVNNRRLFVQSFGNCRLIDSEQKEVKWRTKKAKELFAYLWHHRGNPVSRAYIIEALWGDLEEERATTIMHTTVYQLRKLIRLFGYENPVKLINEQYVLNVEVDSDFDQLQEILQSGDITRPAVEKALNLYQGDYLEEAAYFWALAVQQELKQSFLKYLEDYVTDTATENGPSCLKESCLGQMTALDPFNEKYVYLLLEHYGKMNNLPDMIALYERFQKSWLEELGIDIPEEIKEIYQHYILNL